MDVQGYKDHDQTQKQILRDQRKLMTKAKAEVLKEQRHSE